MQRTLIPALLGSLSLLSLPAVAQDAPAEPAAPVTPAADAASAAADPIPTPPAELPPAAVPAAVTAAEPAAAVEPEVPEPAAEAEAEPVAGRDKGFFLASEDGLHKVTFQGRVQTRYTYEAIDGGDNESQLSIPRARLTLKGHTLAKELTYKFQTDFGKGAVGLKDFYIDYAFVPKAFQLRMGQYKKPFSRQQINSSGKLEFVDRSITDKAFGAGRDIGVTFHNNYEKSPQFEYAVGVFNGTGDKGSFSGSLADGSVTVDTTDGMGEVADDSVSGKTSNVPDMFKPTVVVRAGYNHGGIKGYSEADFEGGPFRFALGASGLFDLDANDDDRSIRAEVDYVLKVEGFSSTGAFYIANEENDPDSIGLHAQLGYLIDDTWQPALRFAMVDPKGDDNNTQEIMGALSVYPFGHNFKWQTDLAAIGSQNPGGDTTDIRVRSQAQLAF